jgi:hypothetical protein
MASQLPPGSDSNYIAAQNETHRSVVALEFAGGSKPHYDGPEFLPGGIEQVPGAAPTTLAVAVNRANEIKALLNDHYSRHNAGSGRKIYAHKVVDAANPVVTADMAAGSTFEAALLASLVTLTNSLRLAFVAHGANLKPDGTASGVHATADVTNILGGLPVLTDFAGVADALNLLKGTYNDHIAFSAGGSPHLTADSTNGVSAANADSSNLDTLLTLANQLRTKLLAHFTQSGVHSVDDTFNNATVTAAATYPANLFALANEIKASYGAHRQSTTYHEVADGTNTISASDATTVATLIALVAELATDVAAHFRFAPVTRAVR